MTFIYSRGENDDKYTEGAITIIKLVSKNHGKIIGSSVLWFLRAILRIPGKYYNYFQTQVEYRNEQFTFVRGIDIVFNEREDKQNFIQQLKQLGEFENSTFNYKNLTYNICIYNEKKLPIIIPFASRNFELSINPLTINLVKDTYEFPKYSLKNLLYNTYLMCNYWDNPITLPYHTKSGDPIRIKKSIEGELTIEQQLHIVMNDEDIVYNDLLIPNQYEGEVVNDVCSICLNALDSERPVYKTECNHFFHMGCIAEYLFNYYVSVHAKSKNSKLCKIDNEGSNSCCPMCRTPLFNIDMVFENNMVTVFDFIKAIFES